MNVEIDGLRFERSGRHVLDIPSLRLRGQRTTAILGPNGAGKTTLLRLMATLESPTAGRILINGLPLRPDRRTRQHVAFVFQEQVFLRQSVRDNLELGLKVRRLSTHERGRRIDEVAELLDICGILDCRADRLSMGEGRRVNIARAICLRAPLLLLDEPLAALDGPTYTRLLDELPHLLGSSGATTVLVTHNRDEAFRLAQDLVVLIDGRVHAASDKRDVIANPGDRQAAEILGYNVLVADGRAVAVQASDLKLGGGPVEFSMMVDNLIELMDRREIVGRIGTVRVRLTVPLSGPLPSRDERLLVHADSAVTIDGSTSKPRVE